MSEKKKHAKEQETELKNGVEDTASDAQPAEDTAAQAASAEAEQLAQAEARVAELQRELQASQEDLLRMAAELENQKKRLARDMENTRKYAIDKVIKGLIPVADSFDKALEVIDKADCEVTVEQLIQGTELTHKVFMQVLGDNGIEVINPVGEKFDPEKHEAMSAVPSEGHEKNTVIEVFQKGYLLNDRVVRAAMVVVAS